MAGLLLVNCWAPVGSFGGAFRIVRFVSLATLSVAATPTILTIRPRRVDDCVAWERRMRYPVCPQCRQIVPWRNFHLDRAFACPGCGAWLSNSRAYSISLNVISLVIGALLSYRVGIRGWWLPVVTFLVFYPVLFLVVGVARANRPPTLRETHDPRAGTLLGISLDMASDRDQQERELLSGARRPRKSPDSHASRAEE